jgi:8-oxo-dGTP pyrophosphatase MutT (NUDIX family)
MQSPVAPRLAATVLVLRDQTEQIEVLMVERHHQIDFASGALVFPGGSVNAGDYLLEGESGKNGEDADSDALRVAAIRETFEESGILFARRAGEDEYVSEEDQLSLQRRYRASLISGSIAFERMIADEHLTLATEALTPFAHWITPEGLPKRFDTHFFLACAPAHHHVSHDGRETVASMWLTPARALSGQFKTVIATKLNLQKLAVSHRVADAIAAAKKDKSFTVLPVLYNEGTDKRFIRIPLEAGYAGVVFEV